MKVKVGLSIGFPAAQKTSVIEIPDEELEGKSQEEKEEIINEYVRSWAEDHIETWWTAI